MSADEATVGDPLRALVRRGAVWSVGTSVGAQVLRFAGNLVASRLLFPEAFGLMAIVNALIIGLHLFSDIGIGPSIIQSARGNDPAFLNTAWTVKVIRGVALWLVSCAIAVPVAAFYEDSRLAWPLAITGLAALIGGFNSTRLHSMYRSVDLARVSLIDLASQAVGLAVMIAWALWSPSVWALVWGGIAGSLVTMVLSYVALPGIPNRFQWERSALRQMMNFGRWIFLSTVLSFLVMQSDKLLFGKLVPLATLGAYGFAAAIATMPGTLLGKLASDVFFPLYSRVHNAGENLQAVFTRTRRPWLIVVGWAIAGLAGGGKAIAILLYDQRYLEAGWITQLLALGGWFGILEVTNGSALLSRGKAKWVAASGAGKLAGMVVLIPLGYRLGEFPGAVLGLVASEVLRYAVSAVGVARAGLKAWPQDMGLTAWVLATAWTSWQVAEFGQGRHWSPIAVAAAVFVAGTLVWLPFARSVYVAFHRRSP